MTLAEALIFHTKMSRKPKSTKPDDIDPSVYCYDEVYDEMKNEASLDQDNPKGDSETKQGSRYMRGLIETANERKSDKEIRKFKKYAKDRKEAELQGELEGTEVIITSAYKRKLAEINKIEESKRQRQDSENDRLMNFEKVYKVKDEETPTGKPDQGENVDGVDEVPELADLKEITFKKNQPKSLEDRKQYLRELLAKRTTGEKFNEALKRYRLRKESSPHL